MHTALISVFMLFVCSQIRKIQEDPVTRKADVKAMARAMDSNTIALVGSCPQVGFGIRGAHANQITAAD